MSKSVATFDHGTLCSEWNYCAQRLATGSINGILAIFDALDPDSSSFNCSNRTKVHDGSIAKVVWIPPEFGDAVACILDNGALSLWEEVAQDGQSPHWKLCKCFQMKSRRVLDIQFGFSSTSLKLVAAYSDGYVRVYELQDPLELANWQLQAEFQNVIDSVSKFGKASCSSASVSWIPQRTNNQLLSFVLGYNSNIAQLNSSKVWEFDQAHQRWLPVAELASPGDNGDQVYAVAWAPNIGRPYEIVAVASQKGIALWHVALHPEVDGRLPVEKVTLLSCHEEEVWQMEWDMSGMTLATTGSDGLVRLWQSNLNGVWHEEAVFQPTSST
ncbi:epoxide hydrolase, soluble (sEH) [Dionaea muscipula]